MEGAVKKDFKTSGSNARRVLESLSKIENAREGSLCGENKILRAVILVVLTGDPSRGAQESCLGYRQRFESSQRINQKNIVLWKQKEYCRSIRLRTTTGHDWTLTSFMRNLVYLGFLNTLSTDSTEITFVGYAVPRETLLEVFFLFN